MFIAVKHDYCLLGNPAAFTLDLDRATEVAQFGATQHVPVYINLAKSAPFAYPLAPFPYLSFV
jgi:hypothetical protein